MPTAEPRPAPIPAQSAPAQPAPAPAVAPCCAAAAETEIPVPFAQASLTPLIQTSAFNLWHYRTADSRATVSATGYFTPVLASLKAGDLMVLQASDALALLPIRSNAALGTGVTLDGAVGPVSLLRTASPRFSFGQVAAAVVRTIALAPFAAGIVAGTSIPVSAAVVGPIAQVVFSLRDGNGAVVPPAQVVNVAGGFAIATFPTPPIGTGYRIRVEDATDPSLAAVSQSFNVGPDLKLVLVETDARLLTEAGSVLKQ